eukprot:8006361-Heterocapsa_arctica.AAC.1
MHNELLTLDTVLRDACDLGDDELGDMALAVRTGLGMTRKDFGKTGDNPVVVWPTNWDQGYPGVALVHWQDEQWEAWDYGDKLPLGPELSRDAHLQVGHVETRQCLLKTAAATILYADTGVLPPHAE